MGNKRRRKRQRELELSKSKARKNRIMILSAAIVVIIGFSIFLALSGNAEEKQSLQNTPSAVVEITPTPEAAPVPATPPQATLAPAPNPEPKSSKPIKATWIEPQITGNTVSIPVSNVEDNWNTHFKLGAETGDMNFMAYVVDGEIHVRANICPPCRSIGFSLQKDILTCDRCATTFEARTGEGIEGACVDYPKAAVHYSITDGNITMSRADLKAAIQDTIIPGLG